MAAPAAEVLAAAAAVKPPADTSVVVLFEEMVHTYVDAHRSRHRYRQVYKILTAHGVEGWDRLASGWSPWYEEKPVLRARVVAPGGRAFNLDPKTIEMSGLSGGDEAVYSDRQLVRAPLPGVAVGVVVEVEIAWEERAPLFEAGTTHRFYFGGSAPVEKARLGDRAPHRPPRRPRGQARGAADPVVADQGGADRRVVRERPHRGVARGGPGPARREWAAGLHRVHDGHLVGDGGGRLRRHRRSADRQAGPRRLRARRAAGARSAARPRRRSSGAWWRGSAPR